MEIERYFNNNWGFEQKLNNFDNSINFFTANQYQKYKYTV